MNDNLIHFLLLCSFFLALFGAAELLYRFANVKAEYTRKFVHVGTGLLTMLFPILFTHYSWVICICCSFLVLLSMSLSFGFLPSINAVQRKTYGSLAYPVVVILAFVFYYFKTRNAAHDYFYFYIPILIMALADPMAALFGKRFPFGKYSVWKEQKTIVGSCAFFVVAWLVNFLLLPTDNFWFLVFIPLAATLAEAFTGKGLDNLTIPVAVISVLYFCPCV
jgi:dolichol kinase